MDDTRLDSLIKLWKEVYGEELSRAEAAGKVAKVLALYRLVRRPLPNEEKPV